MKKIVSILFATCMLFALSVTLTSCSHKASDTWSKDESEHWRACLAFGGCKDSHEYERAEHTMSELTALGPSQHSSECSVCGYEEEEDHYFDAGVITTEATKEADGKKQSAYFSRPFLLFNFYKIFDCHLFLFIENNFVIL